MTSCDGVAIEFGKDEPTCEPVTVRMGNAASPEFVPTRDEASNNPPALSARKLLWAVIKQQIAGWFGKSKKQAARSKS